ncbi:histone-like transcription factor domain containing protein [Babesia divergens]|uniref:Histone-like transcription factor domain containing protein n=1 Tax=Babesia divergens TaxID=32595 RepID=A0AAD9LIG9_BABDI|nr:histone-like transcription factor domain containing protein [Babesia divergens]
MVTEDVSTRPSIRSSSQVEAIHHDSRNALSYRDVAPNGENDTNRPKGGISQFMESENKGDRVLFKNVTRDSYTPYVDVEGNRSCPISKMDNEDPDKGYCRPHSLSSDIKADTDSRYEIASHIVAGHSYEELLTSASKPIGEGHGPVSNVKPCVNASDHSARSFAYPRQNIQVTYPHGTTTSSNRRHVSSHHGSYSVDSSVYLPNVPVKYADPASAEAHKNSHLSGVRAFSSEGRTAAGPCSSGNAGTTGGGHAPPLSYESTSHIPQFGTTYDSFPQNDVSFAAFERRDVESEISLPIANIARVMKSVLPGSAKIAKQAKDIMRDCVTEFIMFVSSEASDICASERRKTLSAEDILLAMNSLGFERYNDALRSYHAKLKERGHPPVTDP